MISKMRLVMDAMRLSGRDCGERGSRNSYSAISGGMRLLELLYNLGRDLSDVYYFMRRL